MPCLWNLAVDHMISKNYNIAYTILMANIEKLKKVPGRLEQYDSVIRQQLSDNVVSRVNNLTSIMKLRDVSFLSHNGVFKTNADTTKCRIVYLSNLKENSTECLSHNQESWPGANLNDKLTFALTLLRFDKYLLVFDIIKAFYQIQIHEADQMKLMFYG